MPGEDELCTEQSLCPLCTDGLSAMGVQRSQCLRDVFGTDSRYNVGYIMAQEYKVRRCAIQSAAMIGEANLNLPNFCNPTSSLMANASVLTIPSTRCRKTWA